MPKNALATALVLLLASMPLAAVPYASASELARVADGGSRAARTLTFGGEYVWNLGDKGDIEVTFDAAGENSWEVAFRFRFRQQEHVYRGTAEGSLFQGSLAGEVHSERGAAYTFRGTFEGGVFSGEHFRYNPKSGRESRSGTLTFEPA